MGERIYNFNAGPAALPLPVLEEIQAELLDFKGSGMSIMEVSHRSKWFDEVINDAVLRLSLFRIISPQTVKLFPEAIHKLFPA